VLTTGNGIDPASIQAPANVQVVKAAPHSAVLREAALAITHAGHGVTIKSLAAGVPLVCLPMGRDQLDIAARVVHAGAGVRLEHTAAPTEIASAVEQVLGEASYREAAERIATTIAEETVTDRAVEEIEAVLASTPNRDFVTA
jgi:UDP:flavonoid glycosyltransferase YjiC (YdhE family)